MTWSTILTPRRILTLRRTSFFMTTWIWRTSVSRERARVWFLNSLVSWSHAYWWDCYKADITYMCCTQLVAYKMLNTQLDGVILKWYHYQFKMGRVDCCFSLFWNKCIANTYFYFHQCISFRAPKVPQIY